MPGGGNKAQRIKGNAKPSNSSRAAEFLQQEHPTGFIGFSNLPNNTYGYVPQPKDDDEELDSDLRLLLRKMTKKDALTRLKAIQEFTLLCKDKDQNIILNVLNFWPRIYNKISHDFDHRIREATQQAHYQMTTKAGRKLAPYLKQIIVNWLMLQYDTYTPTANAATNSFNEVFSEKKKIEVLIHCKSQIFEALQHQIMRETADTLSDPKVIPVEEREAKYARFISSSFMVLKYILENIPIDESVELMLRGICADKTFWKFAKHSSSLIRNAFYQLMVSFCNTIPTIIYEYQKQYCVSILTNLDEPEALVVKSLWDAVLLSLTKIEGCWDHVSARKAVLPKLWKLFKNFTYGNASVVYPNLLPFLSTVPQQVIGDGVGFYEEFFGNIFEGLYLKEETVTVYDGTFLMKAYMECIQYLVIKPMQSSSVIQYLIDKQLFNVFNGIFIGSRQRHLWHGIFFNEFNDLMKNINKNHDIKPTILTNLWTVIQTVIFRSEKDEIKFNGEGECFFNSLIDFIYSLNKKDSTLLQSNSSSTEQKLFISNILLCYSNEIFAKQNYLAVVDFAKALMLIKSLAILQLVVNQLSGGEQIDQPIILLKTFSKVFCEALLLNEKIGSVEKEVVIQLMISLTDLVNDSEKEFYLMFLLKDLTFKDEIILNILTEVFQFGTNNNIDKFLKCNYLQEKLITVCTASVNNDDLLFMKWDILEKYIFFIKDDDTNGYKDRLLEIMKLSLPHIQEDGLVKLSKCFISLTDNINVFSDKYYEVFQQMLLCAVNYTDSLHNDFIRCIKQCSLTITSQEKNNPMFCQVVFDWIKIQASGTSECTSLLSVGSTINEVCIANGVKEELFLSNMFSFNCLEKLEGTCKINTACFCIGYLKSLVDTCVIKNNTKVVSAFLCSCIQIQELRNIENVNKVIGEVISEIEQTFLLELIEETIARSNSTEDTSAISFLFQIINQCKKLSIDVLDGSMNIATPDNYATLSCVDTFCVVISNLTDVSNLRALIEKFTDELDSLESLKINPREFCGFLRVVSTTLQQWYTSFMLGNVNSVNDYECIIIKLFNYLLVWKESNSDYLLFACKVDEHDHLKLQLNISILQFLSVLVKTNVQCFSSDQWDFLMCALISWLQTCDESKDLTSTNTLMCSFFAHSFSFLHNVGRLFETHISVVYLQNREVIPLPTLTDNNKASHTISHEMVTAITEQLSTEWKEFFSPAAFKSLLSIFFHDIKNASIAKSYTKTLCKCIGLTPTERLIEYINGDKIADEIQQIKKLKSFCETLFQHLATENWYYKIAVYHLLYRLSVEMESQFCAVFNEATEDQEELRNFPDSLINIMEKNRNDCLAYLTEEDASIDTPLLHVDSIHHKSSLFTYMLSWLLMLNLFKAATPNNRAKFANLFYKRNYVNELLSVLFCLVPYKWNHQTGCEIAIFDSVAIQRTSCLLLTTVLECIPALVRSWFNNCINRKDAVTVEKFICSCISPVLLKKEFVKLDNSSKEFSNMSIKTRPISREIVSIYTVDEISMELIVKLPTNYPLTPVNVDCGKRIGVSNSLWRQWMLQITSFLTFQNGSILEGLTLWRKNVDKRFEGVEECMVCFSIIHPSNYSIPSIACKTCKKKFHPICLYKWFNSSGKSTCPLCRNIF